MPQGEDGRRERASAHGQRLSRETTIFGRCLADARFLGRGAVFFRGQRPRDRTPNRIFSWRTFQRGGG
ncbi:protein of unknown function [Burkholderia multivorans]